ncbi:MAG: histone deacetylase [Candidatus Bathyarchaeota archaeon]|nr:histone deacetylase [Candidatus Bathyarchaeota archaeon]
MDPVAIVYHRGVVEYDFGSGHPFRGDRFPRFMRLLEDRGLLSRPEVQLVEPKAAGDDDLLLVHSEDYIRLVERLAEGHAPLSGDTPLSPGVPGAARLIVGGALKAGELVAGGGFRVAEGVGGGLHHAGRDYGGGFCVFNDVAVCARTLLDHHGLERVLIFDSDAHAGNGTMDIFYEEPRVLFISVHQDPRTIYPGTGFIDQIGGGPGRGGTVNVPLLPGSGDMCMDIVLERVFKPLARAFRPQVIIRNGGSDPHYRDGLTSLGLTFNGLRSIGAAVSQAASASGCGVVDLCCSGYNPETVAEGWLAILSGLMGVEVELDERRPPPTARPEMLKATEAVIDRLAERLSGHWSLG